VTSILSGCSTNLALNHRIFALLPIRLKRGARCFIQNWILAFARMTGSDEPLPLASVASTRSHLEETGFPRMREADPYSVLVQSVLQLGYSVGQLAGEYTAPLIDRMNGRVPVYHCVDALPLIWLTYQMKYLVFSDGCAK
jgi:hypothetical protein